MVDLAPCEGPLATVCRTGPVSNAESSALCLAEETSGPAEVEGERGGPQDCRKDPGGARQAAHISGGQHLVVVEVRGPEGFAKRLQLDGDHHGGGRFRVQVVRRQVLEELAEGLAARAVPVGARGGFADLGVSCAESAAPGRGDRLEDLAEQVALQDRDREVAGDRPVVVVVQGQAGAGPGAVLLVADQFVFVRVHGGDIVLDRSECTPGGLAQRVRCQELGLREQGVLDHVALLGGDGRGQLLVGPDDDLGVLGRDDAVGECSLGCGPTVQPLGERDLAVRCRLVGVGQPGGPLPRRGRPGAPRRSRPVCGSEDLEFLRGQAGLAAGQGLEQIGLLLRAERIGVDGGDPVQARVQLRCRAGVEECRGHVPIVIERLFDCNGVSVIWG